LFSLDKIEAISAGESFVQLAGEHYFLYQYLSDEPFQCSTVIDDLVRNIWESVMGHKSLLANFPTHLNLS